MNPFVERHRGEISGVLSCFDRVVITGTLPDICYPQAMAGFLSYPSWAEPSRDELRQNAERIAADTGLKIEFIRKSNGFRKEKRIKAIIAERGDHPGQRIVFLFFIFFSIVFRRIGN